MRDLRQLDACRVRTQQVVSFYGGTGDETCGVFSVPSPTDKASLMVVASAEGGWDHISVSRKNRCPNWPEMEHAKRLFFEDNETAMQLHVPAAEHLSFHPYCLHIWRPQMVAIPRPPQIFVGPKTREVA